MNFPLTGRFLGAASLAAIALPSVAMAQTTPAADAPAAEEIVVTGTRIPRPETAMPNPIISVDAQDIQRSGTTNVTDYLKTLPALVASQSSYDNSGDRSGIGRSGLNLLNLRNLGPDRTLVLVDGRRHVSSVEGLQTVDLNTIPEELIERVEISTGGASAIYGADGVTGVVNVILKHNFEGLTGRAQAGISSHGDAGQRLLALTAGHNFADGRANVTLAWEHGEEDSLAASQRSYLSGPGATGLFLNPNGTFTYVPLSNVRYFGTSREGAIDVDFNGVPDFVGANGAPYDTGMAVGPFSSRGTPAYQQGGSGTLLSDYGSDLLPRIRRDVFNGMASFKASDAFQLHVEAKYARTHTTTLSQPSFGTYLINPDNPYTPAAVQPFVSPFGLLLSRDNFDFGRQGEDITRETVRTVIGADGELSPHLKYDLSYVFGRTDVTNRLIGNRYLDRFLDAIDVVQGPNGPTCRVNLAPYVSNFPAITFAPGQCVPLNLFGEGQNSRAAIDWIMAPTVNRSRLEQHVVSGSLTGDTGTFLTLPGGPARFAVGGEYRKEISNFTPDSVASQGLTFSNMLPSTHGSFEVKEAFGEVSLPLLADAPFAHLLNVGAALRLSDYTTVGKTTAWKVDGNWAPVPDLTLRGTYSVAVRAPNIAELFSGAGQTFATILDPCSPAFIGSGTQYRAANCAQLVGGNSPSPAVQVGGILTGNDQLTEERANTWTAGVVLRPSAIPHLTLTADWYDIRINNAISLVTANQAAQYCVDLPTVANSYCGMIARDGSGNIVGFSLSPLNVSSYSTAGLDLTLDYVIPTERAGTFRAHIVANYLHRLDFTTTAGTPAIDRAGLGGINGTSPKYQATADLGWTQGQISANWRISYFSKTNRFDNATTAADPTITAPQYLQYKARFVNDIYLSADVTEQFQIYAGVDNLFNQQPDIQTLGDTIHAPAYPVSAVGRYFYVGAKVKLADLFR